MNDTAWPSRAMKMTVNWRTAGWRHLATCLSVALCLTAVAPTSATADRDPLGRVTAPLHGKQIVAVCGKHQGREKFICYEALFLQIVGTAGVEAAMDMLVVAGVMDTDVQRDGHVYAHAIGIDAYNRSRDVGQVFTRCSELFQSGCYHGVIQAYLDDALDATTVNDTEQLNRVCAPYRHDASGSWLLFQCLHAMGHGLTSYYGHHLPRALHACDSLTEDWDRHSCYGGAFMENVIHATNPNHPSHIGHQGHDRSSGHSDFVPIKADDPLHPCSILEDRYVPDCYQMQTSIILHHNHGDMAAAARVCDTAPVAMRPACYQSLGRDISSYTLQQHEESIRLCSLGSPAYQPWCYVGLVKNFIDVTARAESGLSFCPRVPGRANQLKCYEAVGEEIWALTGENRERDRACSTIQGEGREACRYGARIRLDAPPGIPVAEQR